MLLIWPLFSAGENLALIAEIPQDLINGTVGQSVLLPFSYKFNSTSEFPLPILWTFNNSLNPFISCTVQSCSLSTEGTPRNCSANCFPSATYQDRVEFFPESASLLLRNLQLNDSGVYSVT
ncbi:Hepatocyte cell adhesion molecule, partial [Tinamus guttatus]